MSITANPFNHAGLGDLLMMEWGHRKPHRILAKQSVVISRVLVKYLWTLRLGGLRTCPRFRRVAGCRVRRTGGKFGGN